MQFIVRCVDRVDAPGLRASVRPTHLEYLGSFGSRIVLAGPTLTADAATPTGSVIVIEADDLDAARQFAANDPYAIAGLFQSVTVEPYRIVIQHARTA